MKRRQLFSTLVTTSVMGFAVASVVYAGSVLKITDYIWNPDGSVEVADRLRVTKEATFKKDLQIYGKVTNPTGYLNLHDDVLVDGAVDAKGDVSDSEGTLTLADDTAITGDLTIESNAEIKGEIFNSNDAVIVNDDLLVTGNFSVNSIETPTESGCDTNGTITYDENYLYICVSNNWKKLTLSALQLVVATE